MKLPELRDSLSTFQRDLLGEMSEHLLRTEKGLFSRALYHRFGKSTVVEALKPLLDGIIFEENDPTCRLLYKPTFLGILLSSHAAHYEDLLSKYLEFIQGAVQANFERDAVASDEVQRQLALSKADSFTLYRLVIMSCLFSTGSYSPNEGSWTLGFPRNVDDLPDWNSKVDFIHDLAMKMYNARRLYSPHSATSPHVFSAQSLQHVSAMNKCRILFLSANPHGPNQLDLDEESREISQKVNASEHRDALEILTKLAVRPDDLLQYLNQYRPHVVHFSGHGSETEEILLLDSNKQPKPVGKDALIQLFSSLKDNIRLVILNACYSRSQAEAITEVIDCAIGMKRAIGDQAAIVFASAFYRAVGFGRSVNDAFEQGKAALMLEGIPEHDIPELLVRGGVDAKTIFLISRTGDVSHPF